MLKLVDINAPGNMQHGLFLLANAAEQKANEELESRTILKIQQLEDYLIKTFQSPVNTKDERFAYCARGFLGIGEIDRASDVIKRIENTAKKDGLIKSFVNESLDQKKYDVALQLIKILNKNRLENVKYFKLTINKLLKIDNTKEAFQFIKIMKPSEVRNELLNKVSEQFAFFGDDRMAAEAEKSKTTVRKKVTHSKPVNNSTFSILDF